MSTAEHAGCIPGQCRAGDQWRATGCGAEVDGATWGGGPSAEDWPSEAERDALACRCHETLCPLHNEAADPVVEWEPDVLFATVECILAARRQRPEAECDGSGRCPAPLHVHGCYADQACSACDDPADHPAQRPEGVTVAEWGVQFDTGDVFDTQSERVARELAAFNEADRAVTRQRTTFPDVVTEWAEVSGDTEAGGHSANKVLICETPNGCTCGAPATTPRGMHHGYCAVRKPAPGGTEAGGES